MQLVRLKALMDDRRRREARLVEREKGRDDLRADIERISEAIARQVDLVNGMERELVESSKRLYQLDLEKVDPGRHPENGARAHRRARPLDRGRGGARARAAAEDRRDRRRRGTPARGARRAHPPGGRDRAQHRDLHRGHRGLLRAHGRERRGIPRERRGDPRPRGGQRAPAPRAARHHRGHRHPARPAPQGVGLLLRGAPAHRGRHGRGARAPAHPARGPDRAARGRLAARRSRRPTATACSAAPSRR